MWFILSTTAALAAPVTHTHDAGLIARDAERGALTRAEATWLSYLAHVEPDALPAPYADDVVHTDGGSCLTGLVMELETVWDELDVSQRERISEHLAPDGVRLFQPPVDVSYAAGAEKGECALADMDNVIYGERFAVYWDDGVVSSSTANNFLDELEYGWDVQVDELGWNEPDGTDDYYIGVYVTTGGASAYTTVTNCGRYYLPYVVAGSGSFSSSTWWKDMATHEFNHAIQFSYGYAFEFYWWEATATYIQDLVYPSHEWWSTYITGYSDNPWMALNIDKSEDPNDQDIFYHQYGMAILGNYLDEHVGGDDFVRQTWQRSSRESGYYGYGVPDAVEDLGYDWNEVYAGFVAANTVMEYDEQDYYPEVEVHKTIEELPQKATANSGRKALGQYGQNFVSIDTDLATSDQPNLAVEVESSKKSEFRVLMVGTSRTAVQDIVEIELEDGDGTGFVADFGSYKKLWAVITPTADAGDMDYTVRFSLASDVEAGFAESQDTDTDSSDTDASDTDSGDDTGGNDACGCSAGGLAGAGWLLPLLGAGVIRRRRR